MSLTERLQKDLIVAMKAKDELRLETVRMIKAALMKYKADNMKEADEAAGMQLLNLLLKQRREAAELFRKGGRAELADKEDAEARILEGYMPAMASEEDLAQAIEAALSETGAASFKQMGVVMKAAQAKLAGKRADGKLLSEKVRARLS